MHYFWFLNIDPDVEGLVNKDSILMYIRFALDHPLGWSKYGYTFTEMPEIPDNVSITKKVIKIRMSSSATIEKICGFGDRSCADTRDSTVYLNIDRYLYGSEAAQMLIDKYRIFIILHEVGHILGFIHEKCPCIGCIGNTMMEVTKYGWQGCTPNIFPTF